MHCVTVRNAAWSVFQFCKSLHTHCNSMQEFWTWQLVSTSRDCHHDYEGSNARQKKAAEEDIDQTFYANVRWLRRPGPWLRRQGEEVVSVSD